MKFLWPAVFLSILLVGGCGGSGGGGSDEAQIRSLNEQVVKAFNDTNPQAFHAILDSESRKSCSLKDLAGLFMLVKAFAGKDKLELVEVRNIKVDGSRATATTVMSMAGKQQEPDENVYLKEDGKWRFTLGEDDDCGFGG